MDAPPSVSETVYFVAVPVVLLFFIKLFGNTFSSSATLSLAEEENVRYPLSKYIAARPYRERFPMDADSREEAVYYLQNRATQGLVDGLSLDHVAYLEDWGVLGKFSISGESTTYYALYVLSKHRGAGRFNEWLMLNPEKTILTHPDCKLEGIN